jgi:hypothetical protein
MDPDSDPAIFIIDLQDANKNHFFFFSLLFFEGTFTSFFRDKSKKESQNIRNQVFSYHFCMMIEGSGSIPLTSGSRSGFGTTTLLDKHYSGLLGPDYMAICTGLPIPVCINLS